MGFLGFVIHWILIHVFSCKTVSKDTASIVKLFFGSRGGRGEAGPIAEGRETWGRVIHFQTVIATCHFLACEIVDLISCVRARKMSIAHVKKTKTIA